MNAPTPPPPDLGAVPTPERVAGATPVEPTPAVGAADPASASLGRALRTAFLILQFLMLGLIGFFVYDRFTTVDEGEVLVVQRNGAYRRDGDGALRLFEPGTVVFLWPGIDKPIRLPYRRDLTMELEQEFWPRLNHGKREFLPKSGGLPEIDTLDPNIDGYLVTGDRHILHARWSIKYRITDVERYLTVSEDPEAMLRITTEAVLTRAFAGISVDRFLFKKQGGNDQPSRIFAQLSALLRDALRGPDGKPAFGIELQLLEVQGIHPPGKTDSAFKDVQSADSKKRERIEKARKEATLLEKEAESEHNRLVSEAMVEKARIASRAQADAERVAKLRAKFEGDPEGLSLFLRQLEYEALAEALANARKYTLPSGKNVFWARPDPTDYLDAGEGADGSNPKEAQ